MRVCVYIVHLPSVLRIRHLILVLIYKGYDIIESTMKQISHVCFFFLLFVFLSMVSYHSHAGVLAPKQAEENMNDNTETTHVGLLMEEEELLDIIGSEKCGGKDEECVKKRMISEAHLDYIYTQNHKP